MIEINLLDNRRKEVLARQAAIAKVVFFSIVSLIVTGSIFAGALLFRIYEGSRLTRVESEVSQLKNNINSYNDVFSTLEVVKNKVASVDQILSNRELTLKKIDLFFSLNEQKLMQIRSVGFGGSAKPYEFEINGYVDNIAEFVRLNNYFISMGKENALESVLLQNLSRGVDGNYQVVYLIRFSSNK